MPKTTPTKIEFSDGSTLETEGTVKIEADGVLFVNADGQTTYYAPWKWASISYGYERGKAVLI